MLEASSDLPNDVAELQAIIASQNEKLSIFETELKERDCRIEKLQHQLAGSLESCCVLNLPQDFGKIGAGNGWYGIRKSLALWHARHLRKQLEA